MSRKQIVLIGLVLALLGALAIGGALAQPAQADAFAELDGCAVLDLTGDALPDIVACGGSSYTLSPFRP